MSADPTMTAAQALDGAWPFCAVKIELPAATLRLLDGSGVITIGGETYSGSDPTFGTIGALDAISEAIDNEAPEIRIVFNPDDTASATVLVDPAMQGSKVTVMVGVANPATGASIGTPEIIFDGEIDVPTLHVSQGVMQVEFTAVSVFERLFEVDEGERATDGFHQSIWPGETGLSGMTGTAQKLYWMSKLPNSGAATAYGGGAAYRYGRAVSA